MHNSVRALLLTTLGVSCAFARVVVFEQAGFAAKALPDAAVVGADALKDPATLKDTDLLVLPGGPAFPGAAWGAIRSYLRAGGNLLVACGVVPEPYAREMGFLHSYEIPRLPDGVRFAWQEGYGFLRASQVRANRFYAVEGDVNGLGFMVDAGGDRVAAPVIASDRGGSRVVLLDFEPEPGYWDSSDGSTLIRETAAYARRGAASFWIETLFAALKPGEFPELVVHLNGRHAAGEIRVDLLSGNTVLDTARIPCTAARVDAPVDFRRDLAPGFYTLRAIWPEGEFARNGFWVEDEKLLKSGPALGVAGDFLTRDGKPWFPVGANYFTTGDSGWDFSSPRNAWVWERDFADMSRHGVTFVRTGVWMSYKRFIEPSTDMVSERFLRNLEAFLLCAHHNNIAVNFTFFAFAPETTRRGDVEAGPNPYLDPGAVYAEKMYVTSVVNRFKGAPWVSWDLINEPSFSNPRRLWKGNTPTGDAVEVASWHKWLKSKYADIRELAAAWAVPPEDLGDFDSIPLPDQADLSRERYGNPKEVRAVDYNLFAQDMFNGWVRTMVDTIRAAGSTQLINVGQDEGGVADRVLNQFYGGAGVSFTTNHTYWRDDALLWDSVVAKRPGLPNISGETGYQPVWAPDGTWRYDELTGRGLLERKWALGFAAGNSGVLPWDWDREADFGLKRSDDSNKAVVNVLRDIGAFAGKAESAATGLKEPEIAVVLPQSLQLSVYNGMALAAQQEAVRALYHYAHLDAYAVGEYQTELLGSPKLIILPSPLALDEAAWQAILARVQAGATLLVSGRFDADPHFHATGRQVKVGLDYRPGPLTIRENILKWPGGEVRLTYSGDATTYYERAFLPDGATWAEKSLGKGRIFFVALPLELNDNVQSVGDVYRYVAKLAGVTPAYTTTLTDPGILIAPTRLPHATLYVLTSESDQTAVSFRDAASGKQFNGTLAPCSAALLLVGDDGTLKGSWNWKD